MVVIDFKSVGELSSAKKFQPVENEVPIGIKTPLRLGTRNDGIFAMHFSVADQIHDNFKNLILTNHGERVGSYDFGANLSELSFEHGQETFDTEAITRIRTATNKYMPFMELKTFESRFGRDGVNGERRVIIEIVYGVPRLGISNKRVQVKIIVGG